MAFTEEQRLQVKKMAAFRCCRCQSIGVEIHHIIPQAQNGPDTLDNAAPLCPSCHDYFGANPVKRKEIKEMRNWWYERVASEKIAQDKVKVAESTTVMKEPNSVIDLSTLRIAKVGDIEAGPIRHDFLPQQLINRIRLIFEIFKDYLDVPLDKTVENFRRDSHPEQEVEVWERMANVILALEKNHKWPHEKVEKALALTLALSTTPQSHINMSEINLESGDIELVKALWGSDPIVPISVSHSGHLSA